MARQEVDVAIVGAGPAGLFAAYEATKIHGRNIRIGIYDQGDLISKRTCPRPNMNRGCLSCQPCGITDGIMGAGLKSDGKLHFHQEVIELFRMGLISEYETKGLLRYLENLFEGWGLTGPVYPLDNNKAEQLSNKVQSLGLGDRFELKVKQRTRHVGSDRLPSLVSNMLDAIQDQGDVAISVRSRLLSYDSYRGESILTFRRGAENQQVVAGKVLIGLGRRGSMQVQDMIDKFSIGHSYRPVEVGGRVEVQSGVMRGITNEVYNPCFRQENGAGSATFTFCTNPDGFLTTEPLLQGVVGVNGESKANEKSGMTNFAVLTELPIPPGERPNDVLVQLLRKGFNAHRPLAQTTADFMVGSMRDEFTRPRGTLQDTVYANIADVLPQGVTTEIRHFLEKLDTICPGVISPQSLFIAPEAKIRGMRVIPRDRGLMTNVDGLYLTGDSSGLSGNITAAAITGIMAARDSQ